MALKGAAPLIFSVAALDRRAATSNCSSLRTTYECTVAAVKDMDIRLW